MEAVAIPAVTGISPTSGPTSGGTQVTITGTGFTGATAVNFGNTAATNYTVNSDSSITATSPVVSGRVDVTVTGPGGTSATSNLDQFTYTNPLLHIPNGTVIFGNGQSLDLGYANNSAHTAEVVQDVISGGGIYVITFSGQVINNSNGVVLTDLSVLPAVTYKDANGNVKHFAAGDGAELTTN
ncbi:MAG: IPT/TIG domain-containing protein [Desulfosporosinus sp.]|nr:IPT/TIG domain-containing protein [Desulfosporosinus sp.]